MQACILLTTCSYSLVYLMLSYMYESELLSSFVAFAIPDLYSQSAPNEAACSYSSSYQVDIFFYQRACKKHIC